MGIFGFFQKKKEAAKSAFKERRVLPRWKISVPAKIKWEGRNDYLACGVNDLSMRGCSLVMAEKIPEGCVRVELNFQEKFLFDIEIAIIWHKEADSKQVYGIKFTRIRDLDKEKIFRMMQENFPSHFRKNS